ncbi:hypothetical protein [Microbacterium sp. K35]|uniref:hypothetical protein n=1 Tax=Microbacterium sp. K35 TaxID=2305440 RepID=UPI00109BD187|nr:hypothetical protein [Microbacterium sp. K35]
MDPTSAAAQTPLEPPDPDVARRYLAYAEEIVERRDRLVDRRPVAWLRIVSGVWFSAYLCIAASMMRDRTPSLRWQALLVLAILWGQLGEGFIARSDRGVRPAPFRRVLIVGGVGLVLAGVATLLLVSMNERVSPLWLVVPAAATLLGFGGYGTVALLRAPRPTRQEPQRLSVPARWGTVLVGLAVGTVAWLGTVPADPASGMLLLLVTMAVVLVWTAASTTAIGLTTIGASWRWPHVVALLVATIASVVLVVLSPEPTISAAVAAGVVVLIGGAAALRGRGHE